LSKSERFRRTALAINIDKFFCNNDLQIICFMNAFTQLDEARCFSSAIES